MTTQLPQSDKPAHNTTLNEEAGEIVLDETATTLSISKKYRYPKSNRIGTAIILSILGLIAYGIGFIVNRFDIELPLPYNLVYDFYDITLIKVAQTFPTVWNYLNQLQLTQIPTVNFGLTTAAMLAYWFVITYIYALWTEAIGITMARLGGKTKPDILGAFKVYFLPALIIILFFVILHAILLYGDKSTFNFDQ